MINDAKLAINYSRIIYEWRKNGIFACKTI